MIFDKFVSPTRIKFLSAACSRSALVAALALPVAAQAQSAEQSEARQPAAPTDIIVTAERRNSTAVETPITLTALSSVQLAETGVTSVRGLYTVTPGLRLDQFGANILPAIRGISTTSTGVGVSPNVAVYMDGFYMSNPAALNFEFPDIANVQVLKGPQGTLFGRNATGGAILLTTRDPSETPEGQITLGYGTYDERVANAFASGQIAENLYASIAGSYRSTDGYTRNIVNGKREGTYEGWYVRAKLRWEAADWLTFNLRAEHAAIDDPITWIFRNGGEDAMANYVPGAIITSQRRRYAADVKTIGRKRLDGIYLSVKADVNDNVTLSSYSGYSEETNLNQFDFDGSSATLVNFRYNLKYKVFTQEAILAGEAGPLAWSTGAFYMHKDDKMPRMGVNGGFSLTNGVKTEAYALFADGTYNVFGDLFATAGLRYSREKKDFHFLAPISGATGSQSKTWESWTPRFVLRYQFEPRTSAFISYAKGFASGIFSAFDPSVTPVNPEKLDAYEIGFKHDRGILSLDSAVFLYKYKDMQFTSYITNDNGTVTSILRNVGKAESYGWEAALTLRPDSALTLRANIAYTHGEYKDFPTAGRYVFNPSPASGLPRYTNVQADASGNQMLRTPRWSGNIGVVYTLPVQDGEFRIGSNLFLTKKHYHDPANQLKVPGYYLLDLNLTYTTADRNWEFAISGKNITNKYYINYWDPTSAGLLVNDGIPATVRGTITRRF